MTPTNRYEPLCKIASGGHAMVFAGIAKGAMGFSQIVAIKRLHQHLADDFSFRNALVEEAKIAGRMHHANVVGVRDVVEGEHLEVVMDYVEGASLSDLIRAWLEDPPSRSEGIAVRVVLDACAGLQAAHDLGVIHRDISPANILVGLDGIARVTDFGLAKPIAVRERATSEGSLRGKLGYLAPEYVKGQDIDARVDVFAMGVVLWEAIAKKRLFRGDNDADTLQKIQHTDAPLLGSAIDPIVQKALAKDPANRYPTIAAMGEALEEAARALFATHGDVARSFTTRLRDSIAGRRREVEDALAMRTDPATSPQSPHALAELTPAAVTSNTPAPKRRLRFVIPVVAAAAGGAIALAFMLSSSTNPSVLAEPRSIEREVSSLEDSIRNRAPEPAESASPAPPPKKPGSTEPGKKQPRKNPY